MKCRDHGLRRGRETEREGIRGGEEWGGSGGKMGFKRLRNGRVGRFIWGRRGGKKKTKKK